ncbi:hypothetical protein [Streptomyces alkaliterrae]|uniref:Uncharacterized protein n=1 Tax=Streptomyces alkaliterrae TaxID=2213162 RepID=A0A5P0YTF0_9ACTN|nr:hypothetical protein [Streptomyces alkaliterrae]MBB1259393.1 hypothetical protein [Streptomyces alkaliterrae]MQS01759.1 hypothetical protein [Streptomyces alkaliterrae]
MNRGGNAVALLWREHVKAAFPAGLRESEPGGVDIVLLDAEVAGCVDTYLSNGGRLDAGRYRILREGVAGLDRALPHISDPEERRYCLRLRELATLASPPA